MKALWRLGGAALILLPAACSEEKAAPLPQAITSDSIGYYCGMMLAEHAGPKGQILLESGKSPVWFSSVRDTFTFLRLPEEAKDVAAVYVSDMAKAPSWDEPGAENWIAAAGAVFVVGSDQQGGMGGIEAVPFSAKDAATAFVAEHGGRVVGFEEATAAMAETADQ
jgi:copper chaperone NosL